MRKLTSFLFMSLDGVVEAPDKFVRPDLYEDFDELIGETITGQDTVLLGRKTYDEWSAFWPTADIEPFASFINNTPKFIASSTLRDLSWNSSTLIDRDLAGAIAKLKAQPGKTIGVHGSISLVQSLLLQGALDEMRFIQIPAIAGSGRRLLEHSGTPVQMDLKQSRTTKTGLQYSIYTPQK